MARFQGTKQLSAQSMGTGASELAQTVASASGIVGEKVGAYRDEEAVKRGKIAATETDLIKDAQGVTIAPELPNENAFFGKIANISYKNDILNAYTASLDSDITNQVNEVVAETGTDLIAYNERIRNIKKGLMKGVPPEARSVVDQSFEVTSTAGRNTVQKAQIKQQKLENAFKLKGAFDTNKNEYGNLLFEGEDQELADISGIKAHGNIVNQVAAGHLNPQQGIAQISALKSFGFDQENRGIVQRFADGEAIETSGMTPSERGDYTESHILKLEANPPENIDAGDFKTTIAGLRTLKNNRLKLGGIQEDRKNDELALGALRDISNDIPVSMIDPKFMGITDPATYNMVNSAIKANDVNKLAIDEAKAESQAREGEVLWGEAESLKRSLTTLEQKELSNILEFGDLTEKSLDSLPSITDKEKPKWVSLIKKRDKLAKDMRPNVEQRMAQNILATKYGTMDESGIRIYCLQNGIPQKTANMHVRENQRRIDEGWGYAKDPTYANVVKMINGWTSEQVGSAGTPFTQNEAMIEGSKLLDKFREDIQNGYIKNKDEQDYAFPFVEWYQEQNLFPKTFIERGIDYFTGNKPEPIKTRREQLIETRGVTPEEFDAEFDVFKKRRPDVSDEQIMDFIENIHKRANK